jgi:hypothetical protein
MNTSPQTLAPPPAALSESETLRFLNLPTSRREWLRANLPCTPIGGQLVYSSGHAEILKNKLDAANRQRAIPTGYTPPPLFTR